jgi:hypothetical protein
MNVASAKYVSVLLGLFGLSFFLTFEQTAPDLVDVRQYGARAVNAWWQYGTTVTGRAGTNAGGSWVELGALDNCRGASGVCGLRRGRSPRCALGCGARRA